jgi:hypothetical protein
MVHDVLGHGLVHHWKDMRRRIVQRIIQVKNPDFGHVLKSFI